ncbi:antibiotic biosynthesis monooxygenase family protein [Streptomyces sp. NPDC048172]|uniref:antibiotic biosynthesis monooxygenase family protein n=1 Tax=Streptomyces sp. NPDC048172 TaxID=3365505 RepID=UPI003723D145
MSEVRVLVHQAVHDDQQLQAVREAYRVLSKRMAEVPGLLGSELLRSPDDPTSVIFMSRWTDLEAFRSWERSPGHREDTAPLRPYRDLRYAVPFGVYEVEVTGGEGWE